MKKSNKILWAALIIAVLLIVSCGGDEPPNPNPAPAPQPNPVPSAPPAPPAPPPPTQAACTAVPGILPFNTGGGKILGSLTPVSHRGLGANSLELTLVFVNQYSADNRVNSLGGNGMFHFTDLNLFMGQVPGQPQPPTSFCVSSMDPKSGTHIPGVFASVDNSVALTLRGLVQVPLFTYSPFDPYRSQGGGYNQNPYGYPSYPGVQGTTYETVEISIGNTSGCNAWIYDTRLYGCVQVAIGTSYDRRTLVYSSR